MNDLKCNLTSNDASVLKEKTEAVNQAAMKIYEEMNKKDNNNDSGSSSSDGGTVEGESKEV